MGKRKLLHELPLCEALKRAAILRARVRTKPRTRPQGGAPWLTDEARAEEAKPRKELIDKPPVN